MAVGLRPIRRPQASSYFGQFRRARPKHLCLNKPCGIGQRCRRHAAVRLLVSDPPLPRQREGHILLQRKLSPEMLDRATAMDQAMTAARAAEHWSPKGRSSTKAERFPLPLCSRVKDVLRHAATHGDRRHERAMGHRKRRVRWFRGRSSAPARQG